MIIIKYFSTHNQMTESDILDVLSKIPKMHNFAATFDTGEYRLFSRNEMSDAMIAKTITAYLAEHRKPTNDEERQYEKIYEKYLAEEDAFGVNECSKMHHCYEP